MVYISDVLQKKVQWWIVAVVILGITIIAAYGIAARAATPGFGGLITFYQPVCVVSTPSGQCANCPVCGSFYPGACGGMQEIDFTPYSPSLPFICPVQGFPFIGGLPRIGSHLLGSGILPLAPIQIGVGSPVKVRQQRPAVIQRLFPGLRRR